MSHEGDEQDGGAAGSSEDAPGWAAQGTRAAGRIDRSSGTDHPLSGGLGSEFTGPSGSVDRPAGDADGSEAESGGDSDAESSDRKKRKKRRRWKDGDGPCDVWSCDGWPSGGGGSGRSAGTAWDGCSAGDCDISCAGCHLFQLSTVLLVAAALVPGRGTGWLVRGLIVGYRRFLTRFTPACPSTPSCSEYALRAIARHGARRGLTAAAARVRACGRPTTMP
jgi:hypothetical protein